ncbi:hypothetical protein BUE76_16885 [Cnuella takakiae]|nr:hypothetical protein BUE76_16885 [Cnuella takakiae]
MLFFGLLFLSHVFRGRQTSRANTLLSVTLFAAVYSSGILLLIDSKLILDLPHLYRTANIFMYLSYPLGYLYVVHTLSQKQWQRRNWLHLILTFVYIVDYLPFFLLDGAMKRNLIEADFLGQTTYLYNQGWIFPAGFHFVFRTILFSVYCMLAYRAIYQAYRASESFREENKSLLAWLIVYNSFLAIRTNQRWLGSTRNALQLNTEWRKYWSLSRRNPETVLAIWHWGSYLLNGTLPYLEMPATASDIYNRSGRAYTIGRFRGPSFLYLESEIRFPILANKLISGVAFANWQSASNGKKQLLKERWEPGAGMGLRFLFNKNTRTNLCLDFAVGRYGASGIFLGLNEAF